MAATRKLQAEIDRCMKKVAEGVEKFQDTWTKVHNASNTNQKEKYEEDLKKEIKKLQRLRDQIKTWIASAEIKDKSILMEKRKLIEMQMERFKVVERETKTKAYSKEGLTSGQKLDPVERERCELSHWLNQCIDNLNLACDQFEAEIETLGAAKKKKNRNENNEKIEEYQMLLEKHRDHIQKLETLLRMVSNDTVDFNQVKDIKDDVEYYIENCQEDDFTENEMVYEDIDGLEEMLLDLSNVGNNENNTNSVEASETMSTNSASSPIPYSFNHSSSIDAIMNENEAKRRHRSSTDDNKMGGSQALTSAKVPLLSSTASAAVAQAAAVAAAGIGTAVTSVTTPTFSSSPMQPNCSIQPPPVLNLLTAQVQPITSKSSTTLTSSFSTNLTSSQQQNASSISSLITATGPGSGPGLPPATNGNNSTTVNNNLNALNNAPSPGLHPGLSNNSYKTSSSITASITAIATSTAAASSTGSGGASGIPGLPASVGSSSNVSGVLKSLSSSGFTHLQSSSNSSNSNTINSHPNNSSPSSGSTLTSLTNHVISSGTPTTSLSSSISGLVSSSTSSLGGAQPNFAAAVQQQQQINGHANSLSEVRNSPPPVLPVSSASSVTSIAVGSTLGASPITLGAPPALTNSQPFSMPSPVAVSNLVGNSLPLTTSSIPSATDPSLLPSLKSLAQEATNREGLGSFSGPLLSLTSHNEHSNSSSLVTTQQQANSSNLSAQPLGTNPSTVGTNPNISQTSLFQAATTASQVGKERSQKKTEAHIPPLLGVAPLGPVPLNKDTQLQYAMLEAAFTHMPHPSDSEKLRPYLPRNPCATPVYYPQLPPVSSDSLEFFQKLSTETLFFIFYYMEGTKAQYLAAKALKKHSWRFHTKYMMWFQRYEEPKVINDEFEQGAYIYFDFEKWGQRKKEGFTFEYRFLEDRDLS